MPILKQKNAKSAGKVVVSEGFKPKVQVFRISKAAVKHKA